MKIESLKNFFLHPQKIPSKPVRILSYSTIALLVIFSACTYLIPLVLTNRKVVQQKPDQTGSAGKVGQSFFNGTTLPTSQNNTHSSQSVKFSDGYVQGPIEDIYKLEEGEIEPARDDPKVQEQVDDIYKLEVEEEVEPAQDDPKVQKQVDDIFKFEESQPSEGNGEDMAQLSSEDFFRQLGGSTINPKEITNTNKMLFLNNLKNIFNRIKSKPPVTRTADNRSALTLSNIQNDPVLNKNIPFSNKIVGFRMALNYFVLTKQIYGYQNFRSGIYIYFTQNEIPTDRSHDDDLEIFTILPVIMNQSEKSK